MIVPSKTSKLLAWLQLHPFRKASHSATHLLNSFVKCIEQSLQTYNSFSPQLADGTCSMDSRVSGVMVHPTTSVLSQ